MKNNLIEVENLSYNISTKTIIENISFTLKRGEIISIVGKNGGGKSVLLELISGIKKDKSDAIKVNGKISYMPQIIQTSTNIPLAVDEFLNFFNFNKKKDLFSKINIENLMKEKITNLSGGQMQKVFFIATLMQDADVIILDEPEQNLDTESKIEIFKLIEEEAKKGKGVLMVSHDANLVFKKSDKVICINKKIHCYGNAKQDLQSLQNSELSKIFTVYSGKHETNN